MEGRADMGSGKYTLGIFIGLSKIFHTINHRVLLQVSKFMELNLRTRNGKS